MNRGAIWWGSDGIRPQNGARIGVGRGKKGATEKDEGPRCGEEVTHLGGELERLRAYDVHVALPSPFDGIAILDHGFEEDEVSF